MKNYKIDGLLDFYTFDYEEEAREFAKINKEYSNVYYSYGWKSWVASKK